MSWPWPNFFIVGAPKCGTSSLHAYLKDHPEIFMPYSPPAAPDHWKNKEPNFYCPDVSSRGVRERAAYGKLFAGADGARRVGEASAMYLYSDAARRDIAADVDDPRIIISVRHPLELIKSLHRDAILFFGENHLDLADALEAEQRRARGIDVPATCHTPLALQYRKLATLSAPITAYMNQFGRGRVHVCLLEDLQRRPRQTYRDLLVFLGVDPDFEPEFEVHNATASEPAGAAFVRARAHRIRWLSALLDSTPGTLRRGGKKLLGSVSAMFGARTGDGRPDTLLERHLAASFRDEILTLSSLIDRDLSHWLAEPHAEPLV